MLVYSDKEKEMPKGNFIYSDKERGMPKGHFKIIKLPVDESHYNEEAEKGEKLKIYRTGREYRYIGIYEEIINNKQIEIKEKEYINILEYLRSRKYLFGIAEFELMPASFAVFHEIALDPENFPTFSVSAPAFFPYFLDFLGVKIVELIEKEAMKVDKNMRDKVIPDFKTGIPGDWDPDNTNGICVPGSVRYKENIENHKAELEKRIEIFETEAVKFYKKYEDEALRKDLGIKKPLTMEELFKNIRHHFLNQNKLGKFKGFPDLPNKLTYIGGIVVEDKGILTQKHKNQINNPKCVVYVSFGTVKADGGLGGLGDEKYKAMLNIFEKYDCLFQIRIDKDDLKDEYKGTNKHFSTEPLKQQEILCNTAMYAGVPLICIPYFSDQWYNASLIEYLGIGIYVKNNNDYGNKKVKPEDKIDDKFIEKIEDALDKILSEFKNKEFKLKEEST
uniref:glucuronosyltransferase n=1 Tax=Meloidogyne hapla TaxID=6305 RepID=A0A1I8BBT3_MELHA